MAWIELHTSLRNHPKVIMLSLEMEQSKVQVIGYLICLWTWALEYAEDGDLSRYSPELIESACEWKGASGALYAKLLHKFIDQDNFIHDWLEYAGKYLTSKYRTHNQGKLDDIKRKYESRKSQTKIRPKTAHRSKKSQTLDVLPTNIPLPTCTNLNQPTIPAWLDPITWNDFTVMRQQKKKPLTEKAIELILKDLTKFKDLGQDVKVILEKSIKNQWTDVYPLKDGDIGNGKRPAYQRQNAALDRLKEIEEQEKQEVNNAQA